MSESEKQKIELLKSNIRAVESHSLILKDIIKAHNEVRERAVKYTYQLITAIGVVAGFGFTAISSVKVVPLFILGELLLLGAMAFGMKFIKRVFIIDEAGVYVGLIHKISGAINDRSQINPEDSFEKIKTQMATMASSELRIFDDEKPADINSNFFLTIILYLFMGGGIVLLLSLVDLDKDILYISF